MIKSCKKPPVYFESTTGSFYSQYAGLPLKSCRVDLPVNQSGSGTPSPTNIRDFIPYTSLDFTANGTVKTFTFGQNVYIGYFDILTGVLTVTHKGADLGSLTWIKESNHFYSNRLSDAEYPPTNSTVSEILCEKYRVIAETNVASEAIDSSIGMSKTGRIYIYDSSLSSGDATAFTTAVTGIKLVYKLATPITIPLGEMEINTILGLNSLSSSVGSISAEYLKAGR